MIQYCIRKEAGTLIVGYNTTFQCSNYLGRQMNRVFVNIPFGILCKKLKYVCKLNGIRYVEQLESYTSKASFWDRDEMPVYGIPRSENPVFPDSVSIAEYIKTMPERSTMPKSIVP